MRRTNANNAKTNLSMLTLAFILRILHKYSHIECELLKSMVKLMNGIISFIKSDFFFHFGNSSYFIMNFIKVSKIIEVVHVLTLFSNVSLLA